MRTPSWISPSETLPLRPYPDMNDDSDEDALRMYLHIMLCLLPRVIELSVVLSLEISGECLCRAVPSCDKWSLP